jgi:hypothetical protein
MKLTGKAKIDFERWILIGQNLYDFLYLGNCMECSGYVEFDTLPEPMKFGVYVDFADSVEIFTDDFYRTSRKTNSRDIARTKTVEWFDKIYNQR